MRFVSQYVSYRMTAYHFGPSMKVLSFVIGEIAVVYVDHLLTPPHAMIVEKDVYNSM